MTPSGNRHDYLRRAYSSRLTPARPLRALFLGSLIPRKAIYEMLEATTLLNSEAVEFWLVGAGIDLLPMQRALIYIG